MIKVIVMEVNQERYVERENTNDINLRSLLDVLKNGMWIIIVVMILAALAGVFYSKSKVPIYETSTRVIIDTDQEYMKTIMVMIKDPLVMEGVKKELKLSRSPEAIDSQIEIEQIDDSQVIKIIVTDRDPELAAKLADVTAATFKDEVADLLDFNRVQLLSAAKVNDHPINDHQNRNVLILLILGLVIGCSIVFLRDSLDETVSHEREAEAVLGVQSLGTVPNMNMKKKVLDNLIKIKNRWR